MMRISLALFADYALAHGGDRKLYVTGGGIRVLSFPAFPATQPRLALALGIEVPPKDLGKPHTLSIEATAPEAARAGEPVAKAVQGTFTLAATEDASEPGYLHFVSNMDNVSFPVPGDYTFSIAIDGAHIEDAVVRVRLSGDAVPSETVLADGYRAFAEGDRDRAEAIFRDAVARFPTVAGGYNNLGFVLLAKGDASDALDSFKKARELGYEYSEINNANVASAIYLTGDYEAALKVFEFCLGRQVFRITGTLFGIDSSTLFPVVMRSAADYVALMTLNAAWSALRSGHDARLTQLLTAARAIDLATRDDDVGHSYEASIRRLAAEQTP